MQSEAPLPHDSPLFSPLASRSISLKVVVVVVLLLLVLVVVVIVSVVTFCKKLANFST